MRKIFTLTAIMLLSASVMVNAQEKKNIIKTSLTSIFLKTVNLDYEHVLNESSSFQLGFYYTGAGLFSAHFNGFAITPEYRYYLSGNKTAPNGPYIAPYARYQNFTAKEGSPGDPSYAKGTVSIVSAGLVVGVQRTFKDKISLGAYIGPGYYFPNVSYESTDGSFDFGSFNSNGFVWGRAGIDIGIMF
ncbi:MAG TPA: DUF3575 domain-containing protein [Bacteroidales bacterium]|nr:DUF3575 domain-containing protein [Bacteroidales bacterium]